MRNVLYRASDDPRAQTLSSFSPDIEVAAAYTRNPGFGGPNIYRYDVSFERLLDLHRPHTNEVRALAKVVAPLRWPSGEGDDGEPRDWRELVDHWDDRGIGRTVFEVLENDRDVVDELRGLGYDWISYSDDFPEYAHTWVWLGTGRSTSLRGKRVPKKDWPERWRRMG